jgi:hypothetical protein
MSNQKKKKASTEELTARTQPLINSVFFLNWFIEEKFSRLCKYERISRKGKTGIAVKLMDENDDSYDIALFPLMSGAFEGEVIIGEKKFEFLVGGRIPDYDHPDIKFVAHNEETEFTDKNEKGKGVCNER